MKYLVLIPDGMADEPVAALGGRTPMEAAVKPCMDALAARSTVGLVSNVPAGMVPESDTANMAILSVPEGHDKPLKYPLMFSICDVLLINKIDVLPYFDFDIEACKERVKKLNPNIKIIPISSRTGEGMDEWYDWLRSEVKSWNN